jgi:Uncharacterized conserved protein
MADKKKNPAADKKKVPGADSQAAPVKEPAADKPPVRKKRRRLLKASLALLALLILAGGVFAAAVYLRFIDPDALATKYKLRDYPVIGRFLAKPKTNFEMVDLPPENPAAATDPTALPADLAAAQGAAVQPALPPAATPEELRAAMAKAKQEEAKRLSRMARLYGEMKPDEAVPILNRIDDQTVAAILGKMEDSQAAKILAQFDAGRAARLSREMMRVKMPDPLTQDTRKGKPTT